MPEIRPIGVSGSIPSVNQLALGDIAINTYDGKAYIKKAVNNIQTIVELRTGTVEPSISASYATTASYVNPLNQAVLITGSLNVTGSTFQTGNNTLIGNTVLSGSIIISGSNSPGSPTASVQIYGDIRQVGYHRFDPVTTNINTSISASYIYVSGSTNDLYFSQNSAGYNNVTRLRWLEGNLYSGIFHGGLITTQSLTVYQIASGSGIIVNLNVTFNDNPYPVIQFLEWPNLSASIAPLSASYDQSFVAINSNTTIEAQGTPYNDGDYNTKIPIGIVLHQNRSTINAVQTFPSVAYGWKQRSFDFIKAFGPLKINGYTLAPSGSSTGSLVLSGGTSWVDGRNYIVDPNNPSYIVEATGITTSKIYRYYESGSNWKYDTNAGVGYVTIDPSKYSNSGSLTPVGTNDWSLQRVFYFPNSATKAFYIYYGNATYSSKDNAIAGILTEVFNEAPNTAANAIFIGYMVLRYNANFTTAASYEFRPGGLFRGSGQGGAGGSGGTTSPGGSSTQIQYNNAGAFGGIPTLTYNGTTLAGTGSFSGSFVGSLVGTSSFALTASHVNTLNQTVTIGNVTSTPATENTLNVYPPLAGGTGEGGQILLAASGGLYSSASMLDNWQDQFRILRGSNTGGSNAGLVYINLESGNTQFVGAVTASAYSGLPNAYLYATRNTNQTIGSGTWANRDVVFSNLIYASGISYDAGSGVASLTGGKVYRITARVAWASLGSYTFEISCYDTVNTQLGPTAQQLAPGNGSFNSADGTLDFIYAPVSNTTVKIRTTAATNALSGEYIRGDLNTQFIIQQIA